MSAAARVLLVCSLLTGLAGRLPGQEAPAPDIQPLTVNLKDAQTLVGLVDARTSAEELVLRFERNGAALKRHVRWNRIQSASLAGQNVDLAALPEVARSLASGRIVPTNLPTAAVTDVSDSAVWPAAFTREQQFPRPPVTTMSFDARIANWNADVLTDGLVVEVYPLDWEGYFVPVHGTVEVELFASQRRDFQYAPRSGGDTFELFERWTRAVEPEDFTANGVRLRLPFGAIHPELRSDWLAWPLGLVHVRLVVPGAGVFDDSQDGVRVRPWAPNRDYLEMNTGRRFLPTERLGRHN